MSNKNKTRASDTDSDEEDDAQMRQFLEAADHTLLTNAMYKQEPITQLEAHVLPTTNCGTTDTSTPAPNPPKSERYLDEQNSNIAEAGDLHISEHVQTHVWKKLSAIIQNQIEFCDLNDQPCLKKKKTSSINRVKLVSNADCYICDDIIPETVPQKRPTIRRRQLEATPPSLLAVAVDGDFILKGQDMQYWAQRKPCKERLFEYKSSDAQGYKLQAIEPRNEFTTKRRKNKWNESKICQRFEMKKVK